MRYTSIAFAALVLGSVACQQPKEGEPSEESVRQTTQAITSTAGPAVALTAPISVAEPAGMPDGGAMLGEGDVKAKVETSVGQSGIVEDPTCIAYSWSGLSVTATFTNCVLVVTGASLDGVITLAVTAQPIGVKLTFADLSVDNASVDGTIGLYLAGQLGALEAHIEADLRLANGSSSASFENMSIVADGSGVTADGQASATVGTETDDVDLDQVHWDYGLCLPVSGSLHFEQLSVPITVTFLATTPEDGAVMVTIGSNQPYKSQMLPPCP